MTIIRKKKIATYTLLCLGAPPFLYLVSFITFFYFTGNRFGHYLRYDPDSSRKQVYQTWIAIIMELDNIWIITFFVWFVMLILTLLCLRNLSLGRLLAITSFFYAFAIYLNFMSLYAGPNSWFFEYAMAVDRLSER